MSSNRYRITVAAATPDGLRKAVIAAAYKLSPELETGGVELDTSSKEKGTLRDPRGRIARKDAPIMTDFKLDASGDNIKVVGRVWQHPDRHDGEHHAIYLKYWSSDWRNLSDLAMRLLQAPADKGTLVISRKSSRIYVLDGQSWGAP